jgi:hypothetical protein
LEYNIDETSEYKHIFRCELGGIHSKEYIKQNLKRKAYNVRAILTKKQKFNGNFLGFIKRS